MALTLVLPLDVGCSNWKPRPEAPTAANTAGMSKVRVTLADGGIAVIANPSVVQDSLLSGDISIERDSPTLVPFYTGWKRISKPGNIPIPLVTKMEMRSWSATRTMLFVTGCGAAIAIIVVLSPDKFCWDCPN